MAKSAAEHAIEIESAFLAGVQEKLKLARGRLIAGRWFETAEQDGREEVRAAMADRQIYDRQRYADLPHNRAAVLRAFERRWILGRRLRSATVASVLSPTGPLLDSDGPAPPVTFSELRSHVERLRVDRKAPHVIGVCSPSGFAEDVWNTPPEFPNVHLVLVEPRSGGGWRVKSGDAKLDAGLCALFDPEDADKKIQRVVREIEQRRTDLLTGGLSASSMAQRLSLPEPLVREAFARRAKTDPALRVSKRSGEMILYRSASAWSERENRSMSISEWIKSLFSKEGDEAKKIDVLRERRAALASRLDVMYEDIGTLEKKESQLVQEGRETSSKVVKRRIAAQIAHLRKDISRCNTSAAILSKQINVISTHVHNLELAQTGAAAVLPSAEELTEAAVNAEEMLEQLASSDELVSGLEVSMAESTMSDDEADILKELEADAGDSQAKAREPNRPAVEDPDSHRVPGRGEAQAE